MESFSQMVSSFIPTSDIIMIFFLDIVLISYTQMKSIFLIWLLCVPSHNDNIVEPIQSAKDTKSSGIYCCNLGLLTLKWF